MELVWQRPGRLVASPPGAGAMHLVIADGIFMTQLAWNMSFTMTGALQCLSFWGETHTNQDYGHIFSGNGSMASRAVIPLCTMDNAGYTLGFTDKIQTYLQYIKQLKKKYQVKLDIIEDESESLSLCPKCQYRQDWIRINNHCIHCYFQDPKILKLLQ